jgi:hypothetical protein
MNSGFRDATNISLFPLISDPFRRTTITRNSAYAPQPRRHHIGRKRTSAHRHCARDLRSRAPFGPRNASYAGDRGAERPTLRPHDHLHNKQIRITGISRISVLIDAAGRSGRVNLPVLTLTARWSATSSPMSAISSAPDRSVAPQRRRMIAGTRRELAEFSRSAAGESWPQGVRRVLSQGGQGSSRGRERGAGVPAARRSLG